MIKVEDVNALREQLKVGDVIEVKEAVMQTDRVTPVYRRVLRRIRRKHRFLVELEGTGYNTVTYLDILLGRMEKMTAMEEASHV